jgi:Protein ENHANCED DISEASE RESISTANCE 2, C-terminal
LISPQAICSQRALSIPVTTSTRTAVVEQNHAGHDHAGTAADEEEDSESPPKNHLLNNHRPPAKAHRQQPEEQPQQQYTYLKTTPAPMRSDAWAEPAAAAFQVRGPDYLSLLPNNNGSSSSSTDPKIPSATSVFQLLAVDLVLTPQLIYTGLCAHPHERVQLALAREEQTTTAGGTGTTATGGVRQLPPFIFAVNLCLPAGSAAAGRRGVTSPDACYHCVAYFGVDDKSILTDTSTPEGKLMNQFFFGDSDDFRDQTFKLIPRIVEGNFVVRKAVGSKPSLLGTKLKLQYVRTDRYCEVLVDIASSSVAQTIVQLALGYAKHLTVDMMFLFEGTDASTLPERILGGFRVCNVDFKRLDGQRIVE